MIMKTQQLLLTLLTLAGVGCSPTPQAEKQQDETTTNEETKTLSEPFVWPDSLYLTKPDAPTESYLDKTLRYYSGDTAIFAKEKSYIEDRLVFVAHYTPTIALPKEWNGKPMMRQMVEYYNFMVLAHAVETDVDTYWRYEDEVEDAVALRKDLKDEYGKISLNSLKDGKAKAKINDIIHWALSDDDTRNAMDTLPNSPRDISEMIGQLTDDWMNELPNDRLEIEMLASRAMPQSYLLAWVPDIYEHFVGKESHPTETDQQEVFKRFMAAESFDEKAAWGYVALGMKMPFEMTDMILREVEAMLSLGCYSPLLDPLWRAYRIQYNDMHSCPSTYCYSPNLRYNHFRRMIAYVTMRHIEAHPEDLQARLQYYFMVAHTNIVRFNPYPYGNSSAYEFMRLYWSQDIVDY